MTSNEKHFNYKVVKLIKSYKFRIKFFSIRVHTKKSYDSLKQTDPNHHGSRGLQVLPWRFASTAMGHGSGRLILINFERLYIFVK
jgi:hypothetical protein